MERLTIEKFAECVNDGTFIDSDGFGCYVDENGKEVDCYYVYPSNITDNTYNKNYKHINWYNK